MILWTSIVLFVLYSFLRSCWSGQSRTPSSNNRTNRPSPGSGWFPGTHRDDTYSSDPPPPYSKNNSSSNTTEENWRPGFWTGAALGGLGTYLFNNNQRQEVPRQHTYDWERPRGFTQTRSAFSSYSAPRRTYNNDDRGEGSSTGSSGLGSMRRSTGFGGSNVR